MKSANRKKAIISFYLTLVTLVALVLSSYAWISYSSTPTVGNIAFSMVTKNALEIAPDVDGAPGEWSSILDFNNPSRQEDDDTLVPVTFSARDFCFYSVSYGLDGRVKSQKIRLANLNDTITADTTVAADTGVLGDYMIVESFWLRTEATDVMVALTASALKASNSLGDGTFVIGEPAWDENTESHYYTGNGAENAIRIGFLVDGTEENPEKTFVIYEPNADSNGYTVYTSSIDGKNYTYQGKYKLITQHTNECSDVYPPEKDNVLYTPGQFYSLVTSDGEVLINSDGEQVTSEKKEMDIFYLESGTQRRVTIIIWLEGQDINCNNEISQGNIFANLQFTAHEYHSGDVWTE